MREQTMHLPGNDGDVATRPFTAARRVPRARFAVSFLLGAAVAVSAVAQTPRTVKVEQGRVSGVASGPGVTAYLGIPYAKAPLGELRWTAPLPAPRWGNLKADRFGPGCTQANTPVTEPWSAEYYAVGPFSEDCLSLNVWTPAKKPGEKLAVAVWIHGGGLVQGASSLPIYDGANLARQGIVFVSINYRLNVLGFLAHPDFARSSAMGTTGNYGLLDDIAALKWIQANIAAFGGDPAKVTIIGQSGGARSVQSLLFSPLAKGLFRGAIAESGIPWVIPGQNQEAGSLAEQHATSTAFARSRGVETADQLRALPVDRLIAPMPGTPFRGGFTIDGKVLPKPVSVAVTEAPVNDVPVMLGHNIDEGDVRRPINQPVSLSAFKDHAAKVYGADAERFAALFPTGDDATRAARTSGHARVMAGVVDWAGKRAAASKSKIYVYDFTHVMPGPVKDTWGSYHSSEILYWTRNLDKLPRPWDQSDRRMSDIMSGYWLNFIKTGQPNGSGLTPWAPYTAASDKIMDLDATPAMRPANPEPVASFFREYYSRQP